MGNTYTFTGSGMRMTNYFVDTFVAHKMSEIKVCGAPDLEPEGKNWLNQFLLNSVFNVTINDPKKKAFLMNFVRRIEAAFYSYHEARKSLLEHVNTPNNTISPYFRSLLNFEVCVAQLYQGVEIVCALTGDKAFDKGDKCELERLHDIYIDSKHMDKMIEGDKLPENSMCAVWITNDGLESSRSSITFEELADLMKVMAKNAEYAATVKPNS